MCAKFENELNIPRQFGPIILMPVSFFIVDNSFCNFSPFSPVSEKPEEKISAVFAPFFAAAFI